MDPLQSRIYSNEYGDIILPYNYTSEEKFLDTMKEYYPQIINREYAMLHIPISSETVESSNRYVYSVVPDLFLPLDTTSLEVSGILKTQTQPALGLKGKGILIGFLDTGISYTHPAFRTPSGTTRIVELWDQTIPHPDGLGPFGYGTVYSREMINAALEAENPESIVPSTDLNGHGTYIAGVAAGSPSPESQFTGAAPEASLAVVRLKEAKDHLKKYYYFSGNTPVYQETDLMTGIQYLLDLSRRVEMPLVICMALGSNQGDHTGFSPLCISIRQLDTLLGIVTVAPGGNEGGKAHHYFNSVPSLSQPRSVEIYVRENTPGFFLEIWGQPPETFSVGFRSPAGEIIPRIPVRLGKTEVIRFFLEDTAIYINYELVQNTSGSELIFIRFDKPTPGIWNVDVFCTAQLLRGEFHIWLPISGFTNPDVTFLTPDPLNTITTPGNSPHVITPSAYDAYNGSIFLHSSRGYTRNNQIKPDLAAPGVNVTGPDLKNDYTLKSGTSPAAALTAGSCALLLEWGIRQKSIRYLSTYEAKSFLIRGAMRNPRETYPNEEWGYGSLNIYQVFSSISTT